MNDTAEGTSNGGDERSGLAMLGFVAAVGGLLVGMVAGSFRWCLLHADDLRAEVLDWTHEIPGPGWIVPIAIAAVGAAIARLIVRRVPESTGSGIQDVEAVWRGDAASPSLAVLFAKFSGGLIAIGSGLALGREGPTVHMGASIGAETGRRFRLADQEVRVLQVAFGGAGLAVAFNAPLGGALFVFEEIARTFRLRLGVATLIACASAISVSRVILADAPEFTVGDIPTPAGWHALAFLGFGLFVGVAGAAYNWVILAMLRLSDRARGLAPEFKAALIGAVVGAVLFVEPLVAGDGAPLVQHVVGGGSLAAGSIIAYCAVRFLVGPVSYATGAPGGLFAPLLAVGAMAGVLFHHVLAGVPGVSDPAAAFAIVGMAAFFAAVVRAPFTGIVLVLEMTANTTLMVPMFVACFGAVVAATAVGSTPIYDSLWIRVLRRPDNARSGPTSSGAGDEAS